MRIVADANIPFLKGVLEPYCQMVSLPGAKIAPSDVHLADAILTRTRTQCNQSLLAGSAVQLVATATIGYDHIDTQWLEQAGIAWTNAPGCNANSVNEYIVAALLTLGKRTGVPLAGLTLGVVGCGHVGSLVCRSAAILGMKVLRCDPPLQESGAEGPWHDFQALVETCDVLTFHVPAIVAGRYPTVHMLDASLLGKLRKGAWILNTSRGEILDNLALRDWLEQGHGNAVLDVWENEPNLVPGLLPLVAIATPHIAGYSTDGKANATQQVIRAVAKKFALQPLLEWTCSGLPAPQNPVIDVAGFQGEELLRLAVRASYDILRDDAALRATPQSFEELRNQYWMRREFRSYTLLGCAAGPERDALAALGFQIAQV